MQFLLRFSRAGYIVNKQGNKTKHTVSSFHFPSVSNIYYHQQSHQRPDPNYNDDERVWIAVVFLLSVTVWYLFSLTVSLPVLLQAVQDEAGLRLPRARGASHRQADHVQDMPPAGLHFPLGL